MLTILFCFFKIAICKTNTLLANKCLFFVSEQQKPRLMIYFIATRRTLSCEFSYSTVNRDSSYVAIKDMAHLPSSGAGTRAGAGAGMTINSLTTSSDVPLGKEQ